jgi:hypothetical protein
MAGHKDSKRNRDARSRRGHRLQVIGLSTASGLATENLHQNRGERLRPAYPVSAAPHPAGIKSHWWQLWKTLPKWRAAMDARNAVLEAEQPRVSPPIAFPMP